MNIQKTISIDLARMGSAPQVLAVEGDSGTRSVLIRLRKESAEWPVPEGVTASLVYKKSDGTAGWYDTLPDGSEACIIEGSTITVELAPQVMSTVGQVFIAVVLRDQEGNQLTTFDFLIDVKSSPATEGTSEDYYNLKVVASIDELERRLKKLEQSGGSSGGDTQGTLVASYTHTGNLEVVVERIDYGTGTITAQGHGLSENDMIYATVTDAAHTAAPLAPEPYIPTGIAYATRFYAVNVTEDTFQLASAESGDPVAISEKSTSDFSRWHFERDTDRYGSTIALSGLGRFVNFRVRVVGKQVLNNRFDSYVVQGATSYISNAVDNPDGYGDSSYGIGARMMNGNIKFAFDSVVMYDGTRYRISRKGVASCNKVGDMWSVTSRDLALECVSVDCAPVPVDEIVFWNCYPANGTTVEVYKL